MTVVSARASLAWLAPALMFLSVGRSQPPAPGPAIEYDQKQNRFEVTRLDAKVLAGFAARAPSPAAWRELFSVAVAAAPGEAVPMLGEYLAKDGVLLFTPRFPLGPGEYLARLDPSRLPESRAGGLVEKRIRIAPKPPGPPAKVAQVYPTADVLPENLLRIYLHFSAPMRRGEAYDNVRILDGAGKQVVTPFLTLGEELWDPSGQRLTLLLDPGRVKQGLKPRDELGPVLEAGKKYTLVIDGRWRDAEGQPLGQDYRKSFRATDPEARGIEPADWKLQPPTAGTREPLVLTFGRPLDHGLLQHVIHIMSAAGTEIEGEIVVTDAERRWELTPRQPWQAGTYQLEVESILEDQAGNRVGRPFEVDVERPVPRREEAYRRPFTVTAK